ncbi:DNA polymerase I [compost metagenome]
MSAVAEQIEFNPMDYIDYVHRDIIQTEQQFKNLAARIAMSSYFSWDVETSGLYAWATVRPITKSILGNMIKNGKLEEGLANNTIVKIGSNHYAVEKPARICGHAIRVGDYACYIPIEHEDEGDQFKNVDDKLFAKYILPFFNSDKLIINHNIKFDLHVLRFHYRDYAIDSMKGFVPKAKVRDTMVLAHMANENSWEWDKKGRPIFKLKVLGKRYYGDDADDQEQFLKDYMKKHKLIRYSQIPIHILGPYAIRDVDLVDAVYLGLMDDLTQQWMNDKIGLPLERLIDDDHEYLRVLEEVYSGGIFIDRELTQNYFDEAVTEMNRCRSKIKELLGEDCNPASSKQVMKHCGVENSQEKTLRILINEKPDSIEAQVAKLVTEYKMWEKVKGTYYERYLQLADERGFIHPELFQVATVTSRLACKRPNFQALPRPNDADETTLRVYKVRNVVKPPSKDFIHLYADYSQIEMNLSTIYVEDDEMKRAIVANIDIHTNAAENVFGRATVYDQVTGKLIKRYRSMAKGVNFGTIYGMGAFSFSMNMKDMYGIILSKQEASEILEKWHSAFVGFRRFYMIAEAVAKLVGEIRLWTGRRRRFVNKETGQLYPKTQYRKAMNNIVQGAVAEMVKQASIRINRILKSETASGQSRLVNFIHDDINMYIHIDDYHLIPAIKEAMEDFPIFSSSGIPVKVDVEYANWKGSWGDKGHWSPEKTAREVFGLEETDEVPEQKPTPSFVWDLPIQHYKPTIFKNENAIPSEIDSKAFHRAAFGGVSVGNTKYGELYLKFDFHKVDDPWHFGKSFSKNVTITNVAPEVILKEIKTILEPIGLSLEDILDDDGKLIISETCPINHFKNRKLVSLKCSSSVWNGKTYWNVESIHETMQTIDYASIIPSPIKIA